MQNKLLVILLFVCSGLSAQTLEPIQIDRPDQTECPFITPKHFIQVETGLNYEQNAPNSQVFVHPTTLWKYGVNEKFEWRLITEVITDKTADRSITGMLPITLGFKSALMEEKGILPQTSFIGHITTANWGSSAFKAAYPSPAFRFTMQHTLSDRLSLSSNLGMEWNGFQAAPKYIYTLASGFGFTDKLGAYAELYGFISDAGKPDHRCDGGITYLFSDHVIADLSGGVGLTDNSPDGYVSLGFSFRFNTRRSN